MAFVGDLRPYQVEAMERMVDRGSMLLAMVMGSGKTPTTIAACEHLYETNEIDRTLIVAPTSLKYQWMHEIANFTNGAKVLVINGTPKQRQKQWFEAGKKNGPEYVIVNPDLVLNDARLMRKIPFQCLVIDEATCIKSMTGKKAKAVKRLAKRIPFRYALTGTPIENRPEELYSIMEAVDPTVLDEPEIFDSTFIVRNSYGKVKRYRNLPLLHELISEAMVRKSREDIAEFLPKITRQIIDVDFDRASLDLYIEIAEELIDLIATAMKGGDFDVFAHYGRADADGSNQMRGDIMAKLVLLRMLCDDPQLLINSAKRYIELAELSAERYGLDNEGKLLERPKQGSEEAAKLYLSGRLDRIRNTRAPKLEVCTELIEEILDEDPHNKVVVFSSFKGNLRSMQARLAANPGTKSISSVLFHGEMNAKQRDVAKQKFANDPNCKVFLSSDAGGYGVNLPNANYLISLDLPWSAGKLDQRESRIDRLSSEFDKINLVTMMMQGSVENRQYDMLQEKRSIAGAVIDGKHDREGNLVLNMSTLKDFLSFSVDALKYGDLYNEAA